jgi:hypothetical protein
VAKVAIEEEHEEEIDENGLEMLDGVEETTETLDQDQVEKEEPEDEGEELLDA